MRAPVVVALLLAAGVASSQGELVEETRAVDPDRIAIDRGPQDSLGWGTLEDLYVPISDHAAVAVFSGNLVVTLRPFAFGDVPADALGALTYNHVDSGGSPELASGWSWDLGRSVVDGAWGDKVLIDADGYRESFFAGPPPTSQEAAQIRDGIVRSWTRSTTRAERRSVGGADALKAAMASDPLFLAEMRRRYVGPPDELPRGAVWRSDRRGSRFLEKSEDGNQTLLARADGGVETYNRDGALEAVSAPGYPPVTIVRDGGRAVGVEVDGDRRLHLQRDGWDRIDQMRTPAGGSARFSYLGSVLHKLDTPAGAIRFSYDGEGRLVGMEGPDGWFAVRYDPRSGRVAEAQGPRGVVTVSDLDDDDAALQAVVEGPAGRSVCRWDPVARRRIVTGAGEHEVAFARAPLPIEVRQGDDVVGLEWTAGGRLVAAERGGRRLSLERSAEGGLDAIQTPGGARALVRTNRDGQVQGWADPEGRSVSLRGAAADGIEQTGLATWDRNRDARGRIRGVGFSGGESLTAGWDERGHMTSVEAVLAGRASVRVDAAGRLERFEAPGGAVLSLRSGPSGPEGISIDGVEVALSRDEGGRLSGWRGPGGAAVIERSGGRVSAYADPLGRWTAAWDDGWLSELNDGVAWTFRGGQHLSELQGPARLRLEWDDDDVVAWDGSWTGRVERELDDAGRATALLRGSGRWALRRDSTGRLRGLTVADGGRYDLPADGSGRPESVVHSGGLAWRLRWDPHGRLAGLRSDGGEWSLRYERSGRPGVFRGPDGREALMEWDRLGRWRSIKVPGQPGVAARYGRFAPSVIGDWRWDWQNEQLSGFGPVASATGWEYRRGLEGRVSAVGFNVPERLGGASGRREWREIERNMAGRPVALGPWEIFWRDGRVESVNAWEIGRDAAGRATSWSGPGGRVDVRLDRWGDAIGLQSGDVAWSVERDGMARPVLVVAPRLNWAMPRDPLGRPSKQTVGVDGQDLAVEITPLDGTTGLTTATLAASLGVEMEDRPDASQKDGSVSVSVSSAAGRVLAYDLIRGAGGELADVVGFWGSTGAEIDPTVDQSLDPLLSTGGRFEAPGGDPIADALYDPIADAIEASPLRWGRALVRTSTGATLLPSPLGGGPSMDAAGWWRLAAEGGTVAWFAAGGAFNGLRLPSPHGRWVTPVGFRSQPSPGAGADPEPEPGPVAPPGLAGGAARWWAGMGLSSDELAHLPRGLAGDPRAWRRPRVDAFAEDARLAPHDPDAGLEGALPAVPGAARLLPSARPAERVDLFVLLDLAGELPARAQEGRDWLAAPTGWQVEVPGLAVLQDIARRRRQPTLPPQVDLQPVAGFAPELNGILTAQGAAAPRPIDRLVVAADGLPPGTPALVAGAGPAVPADTPSIPGDARASAFEHLGDDPLAPGAVRRQVAREDAALLTWASLAPAPVRPLLGLLQASTGEAWRIEWPDGRSVVVNERGALLSADLGARLVDAWSRRALAWVGRALVAPRGSESASLQSLAVPAGLPAPAGPVEARWGLAAEYPDLPLGPTGELVTPAWADRPDRGPGADAAPR